MLPALLENYYSYVDQAIQQGTLKIAAAWLITVPVSGLLAAIIYFTIRGLVL